MSLLISEAVECSHKYISDSIVHKMWPLFYVIDGIGLLEPVILMPIAKREFVF